MKRDRLAGEGVTATGAGALCGQQIEAQLWHRYCLNCIYLDAQGNPWREGGESMRTQKLYKTGIMILVFTATCIATWVWGAGYESHKKMGIPDNVDPIHETYIPVVKERDFQTLMQQDKEQRATVLDRCNRGYASSCRRA
jgi:hypothetical protein